MTDIVPIIGIAGKAGAGKSALALFMATSFSIHPLAFADPLRAMVRPAIYTATGSKKLTEEYLYDRKDQIIPDLNVSARQLYRDIGDVMRSYKADVFVSLAENNMDILQQTHQRIAEVLGHEDKGEILVPFVFDDVRYDFEADFIKEQGGMIVEVKRPKDYLRKTPKHDSENGIDPAYIDLTVHNDGTLDDLAQWAESICEMYGIPRHMGFEEETRVIH